MSACKHHQHQLALYSVRAIDEAEASEALAHLKLCSECREYSQRLQVVATLYRGDAERSVAASGPLRIRSLPRRRLLTWPRAAAFATAALVLSATVFLFQPSSPPPDADFAVPIQSVPVSVVSIGESRQFLGQDLDALPEPPDHGPRSEFVFSIGTRREDL